MKKKNETDPENLQPDLKHDTMEFAASADGDELEDTAIEEDEITAEELEALEDEGPDDDAYALDAAETDSKADEDNFLTEPDDVDEFEEDTDD
jgi:hypothetical protein